jgi:hypothetical protein
MFSLGFNTCEPECGNGVVEGSEECDPPGAFCAHENVGSY